MSLSTFDELEATIEAVQASLARPDWQSHEALVEIASVVADLIEQVRALGDARG